MANAISVPCSHIYNPPRLQVTWYLEPCTTSSRCTSGTPATGHQSTRRPTPQCTGSPRPSTPSATSCTAHRWNGRTQMLNPPKSPCTLRGESTLLASTGNNRHSVAGCNVLNHQIQAAERNFANISLWQSYSGGMTKKKNHVA